MNIIKSIFTIGLSSLINIVISLITTPIITRIVDPAEYGQLLLFNTYTGILAAFMYFGLNESLLRFFYEYKELNDKKSLLKLCFLIPFFASIFISIIAILLYKSKLIAFKLDFNVFVLLWIGVILTVWSYLSMEMLQNVQNSKYYSIATIAQKAVYCICSILFIFIFRKNNLIILVISTLLSLFASGSIGTYVTKKYWKFFDVSFPNNSVEIIRYSIPSYIYFVIFSIYDTVNNIFVERYCSDYDVGIYGSAFALISVVAIIQTAFSVIWRPIQTEHYTLNPDDTSFISKGNRYITILMFFVGINVIMFKDVLCFILGESYRTCSVIIPFLVFNPVMNSMINTVTSGIEKSKKSKYKTFIIIVSSMLLFGLDYALIPLLGAKGAALSMAISLIVQYYLTEYFSNKYYYVDYGTKKTIIMIVVMFTFAYVNTFYKINISIIILYIISLMVFALLYYKDIKDMIAFIFSSIKK